MEQTNKLKTVLTNELKSKPETKSQLCGSVAEILNKQLYNEFYSAQLYFHFSSLLDNAMWSSASKLFQKYANEEMGHYNKILSYLYDRNQKAIIPSLPVCKSEFKDIRDIFNQILEHEIGITKNWNDIANTAMKDSDFVTMQFANWFLSEQIEEENKAREILFLMDLGIPNWKLEEMFEEKLG